LIARLIARLIAMEVQIKNQNADPKEQKEKTLVNIE
jgi:hypothetical protein